MSDIGKQIDEFLKESLVPIAKENGFKRKGRVFYKEHSDRLEVIRVEAGSWNSKTKGVFSVGLSLYIPAMAGLMGRQVNKGLPKGFECGVFTYLSDLLPNKRKNWVVFSELDNSEEKDCFIEALQHYAMPWFNSLSSVQATKEYLLDKEKFAFAAFISHIQGDSVEAKEFMKKHLSLNPEMKQWVYDHAAKIGVGLP